MSCLKIVSHMQNKSALKEVDRSRSRSTSCLKLRECVRTCEEYLCFEVFEYPEFLWVNGVFE
ncbi:hypothetical protein KOR42_11890 [Thalassoglobus neptunius]|uniref:Uncharacterized protein n=1 Tax=Thalassoglobus neptunius TaxID=1938619 RepID=A0A5C5X725_9PLAN|nr:hypothetical protein KOR42_11890 [Thalassoglobus neptunius]